MDKNETYKSELIKTFIFKVKYHIFARNPHNNKSL